MNDDIRPWEPLPPRDDGTKKYRVWESYYSPRTVCVWAINPAEARRLAMEAEGWTQGRAERATWSEWDMPAVNE